MVILIKRRQKDFELLRREGILVTPLEKTKARLRFKELATQKPMFR